MRVLCLALPNARLVEPVVLRRHVRTEDGILSATGHRYYEDGPANFLLGARSNQ